MTDTQRMITQILSLRTPQAESLDLLVQIADKLELDINFPVEEALKIIQEIKPSVHDFERAFPSICFNIATGVGKTRLMGAFIAYLAIEKGIKNFFVLAPNLTIYNKLITDFTPNTPKYVFQGLQEFAMTPPNIITGDDYSHKGDLFDRQKNDNVVINIFNISKINSEKNERGEPKFRSFHETLGQSYFEYLAGLKDLVVIMDEAHRYRATAGMTAINELKPVLGLELTATAKSTGTKGTRFKNIIYDYNLAKAIHDGYVKKPAIVGRTDFDKKKYTPEKMEELKINDGLQIHESIKAELEVYADNKKVRKVKPFMLIIAKDIAHAEELKERIDNDDFHDGAYKGKVIVVHSQKTGVERDEVIERLLKVESADEPTEIVIHVDMLKEGWDVNNLYTIVPLKTADSKILVEQSIGRGLRLPYGQLTKVDAIDRLNIIAHDKFADIIKAAEAEEFEFQKEYIDAFDTMIGRVAKQNTSTVEKEATQEIQTKLTKTDENTQRTLPVFTNEQTKQILNTTQEAIEEFSPILVHSTELLKPENQTRLVEIVKEKLAVSQLEKSELSLEPTMDVSEAVQIITQKFVKLNLDIPRIKIMERIKGERGFTFVPFKLDTSVFDGYKPIPQKIIVEELLNRQRRELQEADFQDLYEDERDYLIEPLMNKDAINYSYDADLIYALSEEAIAHIRSYVSDELTLRKILFFHAENIADKIYQQMYVHIKRAETERVVKIDSGYFPLTSYAILEKEGQEVLDYRLILKDPTKIKNFVFDGFNKCLFQKQKFDSTTEKDLAKILEMEISVLKWFKINDDRAREIFDLRYYDQDLKAHIYCPDFVVETIDCKYLIETKAERDMDTETVQAKADVAKNWCKEATIFEKANHGKEWKYLLVPHTALVADRSFDKIVADFEVK